MELTILGSNSATQVYNRYPSSQLLQVLNAYYLIDCAEGTVFKLNQIKMKRNNIRAIFISHLHGDHFYGLMGLLSTMSMNERTSPISIIAPSQIQEYIQLNLELSKSVLKFEINYHFTDITPLDSIYSDELIRVSSFPLVHKIPTNGYRFYKHFPAVKILPEKISFYQLNNDEIRDLTQGNAIVKHDKKLTIEDISEKNKEKSYAYCSDTRADLSYVPYIKDVDVLYHEATFLDSELERAIDTKHSTASEAAEIALNAGAKKLIIGHYSSRYLDVEPLKEESIKKFKNTELAIEFHSYLI